jgi:hypothetical protein
MNFGTWQLANAEGTAPEATGSMHPVGAIELHRRLNAKTGACSIVLEGGDIANGLLDFDVFFDALSQARNAGSRIILVDQEGVLTRFLSDVGMEGWVRTVKSDDVAWRLVKALAQRALPLASDEQEPAVAKRAGRGPSSSPRRQGWKAPALHLSSWRSRQRPLLAPKLARSA